MTTTFERDEQYVAHAYKRFPIEIVSGKGSIATGSDGKTYIDLGSGIGVTSFGYCDDEWLAAVTAQASTVQHASNLYYTEPCTLLAEALCTRTGMNRVFFSNSGAEANECAIKAARKYAADLRGPESNVIITLENSFHGRTLTTLAATGQDVFHQLFTPLTPGFVSVPANDFDAMAAAVEATNPAGVMIECIQGEGGLNVLDADYVKAVAAMCKEKQIALIVDEVQTGNGRTGRYFAYENFGIQPDIVSTAKGLAGGLPLGATLLGPAVKDVFQPGMHGSTFGGNPVCCAAALSVIGRIDDALLADVRAKGQIIRDELEGAAGVESMSGLGLMVGIKPTAEAGTAGELATKIMDRGVLVLTAKDKIRLLPALNIPRETLSEALQVIKDVLAGK